MIKAKEFYNVCLKDGALGGWLTLLTSVFLLITSLFLPPMGEIDPSVLQGVAELGFFAVLFKIPNIIQSIQDGKSISVTHGNTSVTVSSRDEDGEIINQ